MAAQNENIDYCGIIILLRHLIQNGNCTEKEAKKIASRIAVQYGITIILSP